MVHFGMTAERWAEHKKKNAHCFIQRKQIIKILLTATTAIGVVSKKVFSNCTSLTTHDLSHFCKAAATVDCSLRTTNGGGELAATEAFLGRSARVVCTIFKLECRSFRILFKWAFEILGFGFSTCMSTKTNDIIFSAASSTFFNFANCAGFILLIAVVRGLLFKSAEGKHCLLLQNDLVGDFLRFFCFSGSSTNLVISFLAQLRKIICLDVILVENRWSAVTAATF
jgi:hypothetical protein